MLPLRTSRVLGLFLSASMLLSAGTSLAQTDEEKAAARALATQGADALKNGRYAEAIDFVTRAQAIVHAPTHLLMIARAQVGMGKLVAAQETYLKLQREDLPPSAPAAFKNAVASATTELAAIEPKIAQIRIVAEGAVQKKATVKLDEVIVPPALLGVYRPVDPGQHVLAVYPVGGNPVKTPVDLRDGERREIKLAVPDGPPPSGVPLNASDNPDGSKPADAPRDQGTSPGFFTPLRGAGIGLLAVGAAGLGVGAFFLAQSATNQTKANNNATNLGCTSGGSVCPVSQMAAVAAQVTPFDQTAAKDKTLGAVFIPIGVAAVGAGVALLIIGKPKPAAPARASVSPFLTGTGGGLRGTF